MGTRELLAPGNGLHYMQYKHSSSQKAFSEKKIQTVKLEKNQNGLMAELSEGKYNINDQNTKPVYRDRRFKIRNFLDWKIRATSNNDFSVPVYTVPDKFLNGQKLARIRLSLTGNLRKCASF